MATKGTAITDPELQSRMEEAYQKLVDSLEERKNRFFDPTYLAAAQAFSQPTKTGSAFEALGNVAGAVGKSQEEESKREFDLNKAKFDINKELLALNQQQKRQEIGIQALRGGAPTTAPAAPAADSVGALPGQPPAEGGALTSAVGPVPTQGIKQGPLSVEGNLPQMQPTKVAGTPQPELVTTPPPPSLPAPAATKPAGALPSPTSLSPIGLTPEGERIAQVAYGDGLPWADAVKRGMEHQTSMQNRINDEERLRIEREKLADSINKTKQDRYKVVGKAIVDTSNGKPIFYQGSDSINLDGKNVPANEADTSQYLQALFEGDAQKAKALKQQMLGKTAGATPVETTEARETRKAEEAKQRDIEKAVQIEKFKEEDKRQRELIEKAPKYEAQKDNAKTAIEILNDKDVQKALGPLAGPGIAKAIGTMVSGGVKVGSYNVALANFDEALINIKASPETIVKINALRSTLSREELINAQTYLKGEGSVTNMERGIVQELGGMVNKDPASALLFKVQMAYAQAAVNDRYVKSFEAWHEKNPTGTIADFNRTSSAYKQIRADYLDDLEQIRRQIGVGPAKTAPENKATITKLRDLVKANANKVTQ
jgi:hypothetical protein